MRRTCVMLGLLVGLALAGGDVWGQVAGDGPEVVGALPLTLWLGPAPIQAAPPSGADATVVRTAGAAAPTEEEKEPGPRYLPYLATVFAPRPPGPYRERVLAAAQFTVADLEAVQQAADPAAAVELRLGLRRANDPTPHPEGIPQRQMLVNLLLKMRQPRAFVSFDARHQPQGSVSLGDDRSLREQMKRDWQGVAGFVRDTEGEPMAGVEVRLRDGPPDAEQVFRTTPLGHFEFTSTAMGGTLLVREAEHALQWGEGQRQFVNITVQCLPPTKSLDMPGMGAKGIGGPGAAEIVDIWAQLGGLPLPLTQALKMLTGKLPVMGGVTWSSGSGMRAYYGLEQRLGPDVFDRGPRLAAYGDLIVEVVEYAPEWVVPTPGASEAKGAHEEAESILAEARQDEAAVRYLMQFSRAKRQEIVDKDPPDAEGVQQVKTYTEEIEGLSGRLPYLQQRRRTAEAQEAYYAALATQAAVEELGPYQQAGNETEERRQAFERAKMALETARGRATTDGLPGLSEPDVAKGLVPSPENPPARLGNASMRCLRLTVATQLESGALDFAKRRQPGNYGLTAGVSLGSDGEADGPQAAYGAWYRLSRRFDLKLMVGRTVGSGEAEAEFLGGLMFSLPMGETSK